MKKIQSVGEFLNEIIDIKSGKGNNIFYRGHSDESFELEPSIYRKSSKNKHLYIEKEDKIYKEIIARVPFEFNGKKTIEALALMQHYGVPTRILDLTTNALVALYFACNEKQYQSEKNKGKDGEVLVFEIPNENTCYSDSDKVTILANLAKCEKEFHYQEKDIDYANEEYFGKLLHNIREDKSYFQPIINPIHIGSVFAVRPKLDNPRIIRQQGAFLIFGIRPKEEKIDETKPMAKVNDEWILKGQKIKGNNNKLIIEARSKKQILKELEMLGINEATLFPEIDVVAKYIKTKYAY